MAKDKNNTTEKTSMKRPPKTRHIDVRFTEEEYNQVVHNARLSGRSKSTYLHDLGIGHKPSLPMTEGQEEALKGLIGARSWVGKVCVRCLSHGDRCSCSCLTIGHYALPHCILLL